MYLCETKYIPLKATYICFTVPSRLSYELIKVIIPRRIPSLGFRKNMLGAYLAAGNLR
jgi:hypothetical protein